MTPPDRARSLLRYLDHDLQRADVEYDAARRQMAESVVRRQERRWLVQKMPCMPELLRRDEESDARWEQTLAELRIKLVRATSEYEGALRLAVEAELIGFDERPRWVPPRKDV